MDAGLGDNNGVSTTAEQTQSRGIHPADAPIRTHPADPGHSRQRTSPPQSFSALSASGHLVGDACMIPDLAGLAGDSDTVFTNNARQQQSINSEDSSEDEAQAGPSRRRSMAPSSMSSPPSSPEAGQGQSGRRPDERVKRRREKNKMAAQRCRQRRRDHVDTLVRETQKLECDNTTLAYQIRQLEKERNRLQFTLVQHRLSCTKDGQPQFRWVQRNLASQQQQQGATPLAPSPGMFRHTPTATVTSPTSSTSPTLMDIPVPVAAPPPPPPPPRSPQ